jgi:hypothetical protein
MAAPGCQAYAGALDRKLRPESRRRVRQVRESLHSASYCTDFATRSGRTSIFGICHSVLFRRFTSFATNPRGASLTDKPVGCALQE